MKAQIKKILPKSIKNNIHFLRAWYGAVKFGFPSANMRVIGVTGTSGKSTTVCVLRQLLEHAGYTVGSLSTIDFYIAGQDFLNDQKMTMLGRSKIQEYLALMVKKGCQIAIVETSSEGVVQHRHRGIQYDTVVLTNLYPEHIESHGSFDNYKNAKKSFFAYVAGLKRKTLGSARIPKVAIVNGDIQETGEFLDFSFDKKFTFGNKNAAVSSDGHFLLGPVQVQKSGLTFTIDEHVFAAPMYGKHNANNLLSAVAVCRSMGIAWEVLQEAVAECHNVPGRVEQIAEAEALGFSVIVDYAFEPVAIAALYDIAALLKPRRIIHVCGATGGGRDKARREPIGVFVGNHASTVIITNEDPYDEDPLAIMEDVAVGARKAGKKEKSDLLIILDRQEAIEKAISLAEAGDLVLVTGKGSEQAICGQNGQMIPWDDRAAVRLALKKRVS